MKMTVFADCVCGWTGTAGGQLAGTGSLPSVVRILGMELRSSGLAARTFTAKPSCQPPSKDD